MTKPNGRKHGGARPGSGPKLSPWKTRGKIEEVLKRHYNHVENSQVITPLEHWFCILNDPNQPEKRRDWASECLATYTVAKPKPVDAEGSSDSKLTIVFNDLRSEQQTIAGTPLRALPSVPVTDAILAEVEQPADE